VKSKKFNGASTLGMFIVENYLTTLYYSSWVLDTEYGFHICNCMEKLKKSKRLVESKMNLQLSNEAKVVALAVETSCFVFSNGLILKLYNCYFVPVF
jgi:hypothetical protein